MEVKKGRFVDLITGKYGNSEASCPPTPSRSEGDDEVAGA